MILWILDSSKNVFAWNKYQNIGEEGQMIAHCRVLRDTPRKPTLNFIMIVEEIRLLVYLSQVQFFLSINIESEYSKKKLFCHCLFIRTIC